MPYYVLLLLLGVWAVPARWQKSVFLFAILFFLIKLYLPLIPSYWEQDNTLETRPQAFKFLAYNLYINNKTLVQDLVWLQQQEPDIIFLTEATEVVEHELSTLKGQYPYGCQQLENSPFGLALYARTPLHSCTVEAQKILEPSMFAFIGRGAEKEWTLRHNLLAFDQYTIQPKFLTGGKDPDLKTTLLDHQLSLPIITAPMGAHGLAHVSAEIGTAKGTAAAGSLLTVSTAANTLIEDIAAASNGPKWFQIYLLQDDRAGSAKLLRRAKSAGYSAIVFTVDAFAPGTSDAVIRTEFKFPPNLPLVNSGTSTFNRSLSWDDVKFIQDTVDLPLILKGVLSEELADKAVKAGVSAIQVSNHGGRQLDGSPASLTALPKVAKAVNKRVPIIFDSGIRRGSDVFKALALGADVVALGRPVLYGLALGGAKVLRVFMGRCDQS